MVASIERRNDGAEWPLLSTSFLSALASIPLVAVVLAARKPAVLRLRIDSSHTVPAQARANRSLSSDLSEASVLSTK